MSKRYVIHCLSHTDRNKFKTYKEIEYGDVYAGWSDDPPIIGVDFNIRFSRRFDVSNIIRIGNIVGTFTCPHFNRPPQFLKLPFKLHPRLRPPDKEALEFLMCGDLIVMTENALCRIRETKWH